MKPNIRSIQLITLIVLSVCFTNAIGQIQADSTTQTVQVGRQLFRGIINKINERNYFQSENTELTKELETQQIMNDFKDRHINLLKGELVNALNKECPEPFWYDNFAFGAIFTATITIIALIVGYAL